MLVSYLKITFRNLKNTKGYSFINISGLALGMAVAILIGLWGWDEITFDQYHDKYPRLAQVLTNQTFNNDTKTNEAVSIPLSKELRTKYSNDFKHVALATWNVKHGLSSGEKTTMGSGMWAQPEIPQMFSLRMINGDIHSLKDPSSIILSKSMSQILFGNADPLNMVVRVDGEHDMKISGIYEDLPSNSSMHGVQFFMPWDKYMQTEQWLQKAASLWDNHSFRLFVELHEKANFEKVADLIKDIPKKHIAEGNEEALLHPMVKWHLYGDFENGRAFGGKIESVRMFLMIGIFVLILACINFMNLSTARSERRAKEVGVRKAIGSGRSDLIKQFFVESVTTSLIACIFSILIVCISLPFFNVTAGKDIHLPWDNIVFWLLILGFAFFTGLLSGSYPAFYLSSFNVLKVLKGTFKRNNTAIYMRKGLVVMQFSVSIVLIIGTMVIYKQLEYGKSRVVGYAKEGLITIEMNTSGLYGKYDVIRNDLIRTGVVSDMSEASSTTTELHRTDIGFNWKGKASATEPMLGIVYVTHDFGRTIGWQIKQGRDFSREFPSHDRSFILNESALKLTGITDPIGKIISWGGSDHVITGVVKDLVMESPYKPVTPTVFMLDYEEVNYIIIKLKSGVALPEALSNVESVFLKHNPDNPFDYQFADEEFNRKFSAEQRASKLITLFATLAIFISCLGLFGLAAYIEEQRTKEIGIRKVLGASVSQVWLLLSKDFILLVLISCLIASPLAYYFLQNWLQKYPYRIDIGAGIFILSAILAVVITLITISFQAIKAAIMNPVKSLRAE